MTYPVGAVSPFTEAAISQNLLQIRPAGQGLAILVLVLSSALCLIAFLITIRVLLPQISEQSSGILVRSPGRAFLVGLVNYTFLGSIALLIFASGIQPLGLVGVLLLGVLAAVSAIGLSGLAILTGERLAALQDREVSPLKQLIWGSLALTLSGALPFVGWFFLTPILLMISFGAAVLAWRARKRMSNEKG